jgi:cytochrome c
MKSLPVAALAIAVGTLGPAVARAADPENGAKVFRVCKACHRVGPGAQAAVGPPLNGVIGRKAGAVPDYPYSDAMRESGLVFDEATLAKYLKAPKATVPKTRMAFPGLRKDDEIADVIAYLKSFDAEGNPVAVPNQ